MVGSVPSTSMRSTSFMAEPPGVPQSVGLVVHDAMDQPVAPEPERLSTADSALECALADFALQSARRNLDEGCSLGRRQDCWDGLLVQAGLDFRNADGMAGLGGLGIVFHECCS